SDTRSAWTGCVRHDYQQQLARFAGSADQSRGLAPTNDLESAIDAVLPPGAYTAIVSGNGNPAGLCTFELGANNGTGVGTVEVYDLRP
ncbi:MAG TPA: hypothetical protein VE086_00965, partial [Chthoniobacterales bacterium]|nr:hypothetical protein [Chthoniobacterales bacterium]